MRSETFNRFWTWGIIFDPLTLPLILECIAVAITIPVSSCSGRCFSDVKRILTRLRTSMSDARLSDSTHRSTKQRYLDYITQKLYLHCKCHLLSFSSVADNLDEDELVSQFLNLHAEDLWGDD